MKRYWKFWKGQTVITKWKLMSSANTKLRLGRPRMISHTTSRKIYRMQRKKSQAISTSLKQSCVALSACTIGRYWKYSRLQGSVAREKPLLPTPQNYSLQYTKQLLGNPENLWNKIIWSHETKRELEPRGRRKNGLIHNYHRRLQAITDVKGSTTQ